MQFDISIVFIYKQIDVKTGLYQTIQFSISTQFKSQKTVLFKIYLFSISTRISSIWTKYSTRSRATTPSQNGPGSDVNKVKLCIPQSSVITGASISDCLVSNPGNSFEVVLPHWKDAVDVFYSPSWLGTLLSGNYSY